MEDVERGAETFFVFCCLYTQRTDRKIDQILASRYDTYMAIYTLTSTRIFMKLRVPYDGQHIFLQATTAYLCRRTSDNSYHYRQLVATRMDEAHEKLSSKSSVVASDVGSCRHHPWICLLCVVLGLIFSYILPSFCLSISGMSDSVGEKSTHLAIERAESTSSTDIKSALLLSVVMAIPLFVDTALDCAHKMVNEDERILWYSRLLTLISITGPNLFLLLGFCDNLTRTVYQHSIYNTRITFGACAMAYASQNALKYKMEDLSGLCLLLAILCTITYSCLSMAYITDPFTHRILDKISSLIRISSHITLAYMAYIWWRREYVKRDVISFCELILLVKLGATIFCSWSCSIARIYYQNEDEWDTSSSCICAYAYITMIYTVIVITIPGRIARYEANNATRAFTEKKAFVSYISHEIRTPLNTVFLGLEYVTMALKQISRPENRESIVPIEDTISDVHSSCEVAISILNDLLTSDKIDGGKMILDTEVTSCCSFFTSSVKPFDISAKDKEITLNVSCADLSSDFVSNAVIRIDKAKMAQVIRNLISNALKFTPKGGTVTVAISHIRTGDRSDGETDAISQPSVRSTICSNKTAQVIKEVIDIVRMEVRDTGVGISSLNQSKLFGQYVQFKANELQGGNGSGLGLWISKAIIELHGGIIGAFSEGEGKGTVFYIELPVYIPDSK